MIQFDFQNSLISRNNHGMIHFIPETGNDQTVNLDSNLMKEMKCLNLVLLLCFVFFLSRREEIV